MGLFKPNVEKMEARKDIEGLIRALQYTKDRDVRRHAARALYQFQDGRAIEPLTDTLEKDEDNDVRAWAASFLGEIKAGRPRTMRALYQALTDKDEDLQDTAKDALVKLRWYVEVEAIIQILQDDKRSNVRDNAVWVLGNILRNSYLEDERGVRALRAVIQALSDKDPDLRQCAAWALGKVRKVGDTRVMQALIQSLTDKNERVRIEVIRSLEKVGNESAIKPLAQVLDDKTVREFAEEALLNIRARTNR